MVLLHTKGSVDLKRARDVGAVLFNHRSDEIVGPIDRLWIDEDDRKGRAVIKFDETEDGEKAFQRVKSGSLRGVSVSAIPLKRQKIGEDEKWKSPDGREWKGPLVVADRWQVVEISLTAVPADSAVGVGRTLTTKEESNMKLSAEIREFLISRGLEEGATDEAAMEFLRELDKPTKKEPEPAPKTTDSNIPDELDVMARMKRAEDAERDAIKRERDRVEDLTKIQEKSGMPSSELHRWIQEGSTIETAREIALEFMTARHRPVGKNGTQYEVVLDAREKHRTAMEAHLLRRGGMCLKGRGDSLEYDKKACEDVPLDMSMVDIARQMLVHSGHRDAAKWDKMTVIERGLQHSTSDFPYLLANVAEKSLGVGYAETRTTWQAWCGIGSLPDFKTADRVATGDLASFEVVKELMPITETTMSEKREQRSLSTYAKRFGVSRQSIINDDLNEFSRIPQKLGAAAARTVNATVYAQFTSPPTMAEDSTVLFATTHTSGSNRVDSGGAPSAAELNKVMPLFRKQKGVGAIATLNIVPKYIIVPAALEGTTQQLLHNNYLPITQATGPANWMLNLVGVTEPLLDAHSAAEWYMAADPNEIDTVRVDFLNGQQTPSLVRNEGSSILGIEWIAYLDFSVKTLDHRGLVLDDGA